MESIEFWNDIFNKKDDYSKVKMPDKNDNLLLTALEHFNGVRNKRVLDIGCGNGSASLFFAANGSNVISCDYSEIAIENLNEFCITNSISNIKAVCMPAQKISELGTFDCIYDSDILHHIEPFAEFAKILSSTSKKMESFFSRK